MFFVGLLPQEPIQGSIQESLDQLELEYENPYILHNRERNGIDNFTDCEMLNLSCSLHTRGDVAGILTNPIYWRDDIAPIEELQVLLNGQPVNGVYPNYCMGFRIWLRSLLLVFNYMEIRSICGFTVWALFASSLVAVYRITENRFFSMLYALCIIALNPLAISASLTLMTCFALSFLGILVLPIAADLRNPDCFQIALLFLGLGALTQFFDFYTYPLITFAFPMIVFLAAKKGDGWEQRRKRQFSWMLRGLAAWLFGYVGIWLLKLASTALFTGIDVWAIANNAMDASFGMTPGVDLLKTLSACAKNMLAPEIQISLLIVTVVWIVLLIRNPDRQSRLADSIVFLAIGLAGVVWIILAKRTYEHRFFQYRTLGVPLMGMFGYMAQTASRNRNIE